MLRPLYLVGIATGRRWIDTIHLRS